MFRQNDKKDDKKPSSTSSLFTYFNSATTTCTADQCFRVPPATAPTISIAIPIHSSDTFVEIPKKLEDFTLTNSSNLLLDSDYTLSFTNEFVELMTNTVIKGCYIGFLLTLCSELGTDIFKAFNMTPNQIYWANQLIRSMLVVRFGIDLPLAFAIPALTFIMTETPLKLNKNHVNLACLAVLLTAGYLTNPSIVFAIAITSVVLSGLATKSTYNLAKNNLFTSHENKTADSAMLAAPKLQ